MTKIFFLTAILGILSFSKPEKLIVGTWGLETVEIINMDEYAQSMIDMQMPFIEMQVNQIKEQISSTEKEIQTLKDKKEIESKYSDLQTLQTQLDEANRQKTELTIEKVKIEFNSAFDSMKKEFKLVFNADKTYENVLEGAKGTWKISKDGKTLTTIDENKKSDDLEIKELTKDKMRLYVSNSQGDMTIEMIMVFTKIN